MTTWHAENWCPICHGKGEHVNRGTYSWFCKGMKVIREKAGWTIQSKQFDRGR